MREDFLPIPAAPNYEINSQLICRNRKTGYILKKILGKHDSPYYGVRDADGKAFCRSPKFLRRHAVAAANDHSTYVPIPSFNYRYEINRVGHVRNVKTKQMIKPKANGKCICVQMGKGNNICRAVADLLWEVHGQIIKRRFQPCPCSAENSCGKYFFKTLKDCARFLAPKIFYTVAYLANKLNKRSPTIGEWKITYLEQNPHVDNHKVLKSLTTLATHQAKLDTQKNIRTNAESVL